MQCLTDNNGSKKAEAYPRRKFCANFQVPRLPELLRAPAFIKPPSRKA